MKETDIAASLHDMLASPEEGCDLGVTTVSGPYPVVSASGYYFWWVLFGWSVGAHRLYLGEWLAPIFITASFCTALVLFIVWAAVLLFSTSDTAIILPLGALMAIGFDLAFWLSDGLRGCNKVDVYNGDVDIAAMSNAEAQMFMEAKRLERLNADISGHAKPLHYRE